MFVLTFYNAKGGVGKTTSASAVASCLAFNHHFKVCCIDLDITQNSLSQNLLDNHEECEYSIMDALMGKVPFQNAVKRSSVFERAKGISDPETYELFVCPCKPIEQEFEMSIDQFPDKEYSLKNMLSTVDDYDFLVIDCPPSMGALTKMALVASDGLLVPYRNDLYSYSGISKMLSESTAIKMQYNPNISFLGVFFTHDKKNVRLNLDMKEQLSSELGKSFIPVSIADSIVVSESSFARLPVTLYQPWSPPSISYRALTGEVMIRLGVHTKARNFEKGKHSCRRRNTVIAKVETSQ